MMTESYNLYLIENDTGNGESLPEQHTDTASTRVLCHLYFDAEQTSFEEVASTVSNKDDPLTPCLTLRSVLLGLAYVIGMSFLHQWTYTAVYRFYIEPGLVIVTAYLLGRLPLIIKRTPFSIKENTIILIMTNIAWYFNNQYQYSTMGLLRQIDQSQLKYVHVFFLVVALQFLGFGYAGVLRRFLVWPSSQIWPVNLPWIALLRTLHEDQHAVQKKVYGTKKRSVWWQLFDNRKYFFYMFFVIQFVYCWLPQYIMRVLMNFSWMCMISPSNLMLSQLTGYRGLGVGSFSFDWQTVSTDLGSPLVVPRWALVNIAVGFIVITWILTPVLYFMNVWQCKENSIGYFPFSGIVSTDTNKWSALGIATTATAFATPLAVIVHMFLYQSKNFWKLIRTRSIKFKGNDLHCRLMSAYIDVPYWWYGLISLLALIVLIIISEVTHILQWYFVLLALVIPLILTLPMGSVFSVTGQSVQNAAANYLCLVIAYRLFGNSKTSNNRTLFILIAYTTFCQSLYLVSDMKLAHYMKIPPRILFFVQSLSCLGCSAFSVVIEQYYRQSFNSDNPGPIGQYVTASDFSEVAGFVTSSFFGKHSRYQGFLWIMLGGAILPVPFWLASHRWSWCRHVHIPLMLIVVSWMPALAAGTIFTWVIVGLLSVTLIYKACWKRHVYLASAALTIGLNVMLLVANAALWNGHIAFPVWWGTGGLNQDGCPLAYNGSVGSWFFLSLKNTPN